MTSAFSTFAMIQQQTKQKLGRKLGGNDRVVMNPAAALPRATSAPMGSIGMMGAVSAPAPTPAPASVSGPNGDYGGAFAPNIYTGSRFNSQNPIASAFTPSPMGGALMLERNQPVELSNQRAMDTSAYGSVNYSGGLV